MNWLGLAVGGVIAAAAVIPLLSFAYWKYRASRAFRAEVRIENLRLWREKMEDYRRQNPHLRWITDRVVVEGAAFLATHTQGRAEVYKKAWDNVRRVEKYMVQGWN